MVGGRSDDEVQPERENPNGAKSGGADPDQDDNRKGSDNGSSSGGKK